MAAVQINGIRKQYGDVVALSNINISIESGSFYTLLGPSGCGKTTLLRTIAGFHRQNSGTIVVDSHSIENEPAHQRDVGMVFQDYAVFPHLSVEDNVAFGLKQRKVAKNEMKKRVEDALKMVQLSEFAKRMPHELSGGQQQRVGLARAIVINPTVLLMDEPLSNLDAKLRVDLRAELRKIQQKMGMTTVYVTHDQEEALAMSDTVCVMYKGIIQQAAPPFEVYNRPANRFVANFVGGNNFLRTSNQGGLISLSSADKVIGDYPANADKSMEIVAAVRPEAISLHATSPSEHTFDVKVTVEQISFIGREMEVHGKTADGEILKAVTRPDETIMNIKEGDQAFMSFDHEDISLFEDSETGRRLQ
ncbi:putative SPERMIDINE/PUTRESCINE ABC TRANSPORTER [Vibrio nigripulchritudo MADA3029]|uniref:ABC transporter ATP-binding protein n=1 Tax=Vibrio nigripulchritudo TaxID=28173 RepID=UPI0003B1FFEE|nr:ABC transporter ATP-binding protein [Vibrio nigripulchritudo]CCN45326.1 putative SPERMIDINE/PUTRESCINE ABC TRANSPORTER [Vibrio nigripulchritudo MADA3020]CCN51774.1 putative SPERMIDINE/PUTRESCINE ABC TRANSPORTER [Vibrio nigripulchritudo MADA3021]CCN61938.1 putative SPERMIDINE/PUTRESCINE ABC TRANSPORTER [Vibrio nigripulchritudo MADA3029]